MPHQEREENLDAIGQIAWEVVKARAATVARGFRCACRGKRQERLIETAIRSWIGCDRCLGVVRQVS